MFNLCFVTIPSRVLNGRFSRFFQNTAMDFEKVNLIWILKRREPKMIKNEQGVPFMDWTDWENKEETEKALIELMRRKEMVFLNCQDGEDEFWIREMALKYKCGIVVSGVHRNLDQMKTWEEFCEKNQILWMPGVENEDLFMQMPSWIEHENPRAWGIILGTSYLSESSKIYDLWGLEKFRSLMRRLGKIASKKNWNPITTSNYCTFEETGAGDKKASFVSEQVEFVSQYEGWGSITRFYGHVKIVQETRRKIEDENEG